MALSISSAAAAATKKGGGGGGKKDPSPDSEALRKAGKGGTPTGGGDPVAWHDHVNVHFKAGQKEKAADLLADAAREFRHQPDLAFNHAYVRCGTPRLSDEAHFGGKPQLAPRRRSPGVPSCHGQWFRGRKCSPCRSARRVRGWQTEVQETGSSSILSLTLNPSPGTSCSSGTRQCAFSSSSARSREGTLPRLTRALGRC